MVVRQVQLVCPFVLQRFAAVRARDETAVVRVARVPTRVLAFGEGLSAQLAQEPTIRLQSIFPQK